MGDQARALRDHLECVDRGRVRRLSRRARGAGGRALSHAARRPGIRVDGRHLRRPRTLHARCPAAGQSRRRGEPRRRRVGPALARGRRALLRHPLHGAGGLARASARGSRAHPRDRRRARGICDRGPRVARHVHRHRALDPRADRRAARLRPLDLRLRRAGRRRRDRRRGLASLRPRGTRRRALSLRDDRAAPGFHPHRSSAAGRARSGVPLPRASADLAVPRAGLDPLLVGIPRAHAHFGHARARRALPRARPASRPRALSPAGGRGARHPGRSPPSRGRASDSDHPVHRSARLDCACREAVTRADGRDGERVSAGDGALRARRGRDRRQVHW